jgi:chemotaxis protein methyltransferase CheR
LKVELLSDHEFHQIQVWLHRRAGITLSPVKKSLVAARLFNRLKHHKLTNYGDYFLLIMNNDNTEEAQVALDLLTVNDTCFFREPKHFDFLRTNVLPNVRPGEMFRIWSAASSSGEEPFSLAMTLADALHDDPWEIIGSDISSQVLMTARAGYYGLTRARTIPATTFSKYCIAGMGSQESNFRIDQNLRERVHFMQINLNEEIPNIGDFDVVFLRNVMKCFDGETKRYVVARILPFLKPGGHLIVNYSESLDRTYASLKQVANSIYQKI